MQNLYVALLLIAMLCVVYRVTEAHNGPLLACLAVVVLNWAGNTFYVLLTGETDATAAFLVADLVSLAIVLLATGGQAFGQMLASSYAGQIIAHLLHSTGHFGAYEYWQLLTLTGYGQLILLAIWAAIPSRRDAGHECQ